MWLYYPYSSEDIVTLSSIEFEFPIEMLYDGVGLETETENHISPINLINFS